MCRECRQNPLDLRRFRDGTNGRVARTWSHVYAPGRQDRRMPGVARIVWVAEPAAAGSASPAIALGIWTGQGMSEDLFAAVDRVRLLVNGAARI